MCQQLRPFCRAHEIQSLIWIKVIGNRHFSSRNEEGCKQMIYLTHFFRTSSTITRYSRSMQDVICQQQKRNQGCYTFSGSVRGEFHGHPVKRNKTKVFVLGSRSCLRLLVMLRFNFKIVNNPKILMCPTKFYFQTEICVNFQKKNWC